MDYGSCAYNDVVSITASNLVYTRIQHVCYCIYCDDVIPSAGTDLNFCAWIRSNRANGVQRPHETRRSCPGKIVLFVYIL